MAFLRLLGLFSLYLQNISPINIRKLFYLHVNINKLNIFKMGLGFHSHPSDCC